ncbi:MAG: hypothetical protein P4M05_32160 [Bradyrhizobium sp.]|nr:hypothetical protein [Bradyrhizobium sp.]
MNERFTLLLQGTGMVRPLFALLLLTGCGATPEQLLAGVAGGGIASIAIIHRSPFDALYSLAAGRDCSVVRLDRGETHCRPQEPPPEIPRFCTRSLGGVDCWSEPSKLSPPQHQVADGPHVLTEQQEADRTRRWPE